MKSCGSHGIPLEQSLAVRLAGSSIWPEALGFRVPVILLKDHFKGLNQDRQCWIVQSVGYSIVNVDVRHYHPT
jgi:hypothetical protein